MGAMRFEHYLRDFYRRWDAKHRPRRCSRIGDFSLKVIGDKSAPKLHARAAETVYWFFFSVVELLGEFVAVVPNGDFS